MTVSLYVGPVGSFKSYCAMAEGVEKVRAVRKNYVVANFKVNFTNKDIRKGRDKRWFYVTDEELRTPIPLIRLAVQNGWLRQEGRVKLIVDEASVLFNSRDWQNADRKLWLKFLAHSRKFGYDVIFIQQSRGQIDKQIREACEFVVKHVNLKRYRWLFWLPVRVILQVQYWQAGNFKGNVTTRIFRRRLGNMYDTFEIFDGEIQELIEQVEGEAASAAEPQAGALTLTDERGDEDVSDEFSDSDRSQETGESVVENS